MSNHKVRYKRYGDDYHAECSCSRTSGLGTRQDAEDWIREHHEEIQRVRTHLMGSPSLSNQYNYYRRQEQDLATSESDRALWKQLADELQPRLPSSSTPEDLTLW